MPDTSQKRLGIGAGGGGAVFSAHLACDVAVLVVAVAERNFARPAGGLCEQIAHATIAVCGYQGASYLSRWAMRIYENTLFCVLYF